MLISKFTDAKGNTNVAIVIKKSMLKETKNPEYVRITIGENYNFGLDGKKQGNIGDVFKLCNLEDNTKTTK